MKNKKECDYTIWYGKMDKYEKIIEEFNSNLRNELYRMNIQLFENNNKLIRKNEEIERLNNIIYGLEEILEREIKIGEETFLHDNDATIVCNTLKHVLKDLNKLKEGKEDEK